MSIGITTSRPWAQQTLYDKKRRLKATPSPESETVVQSLASLASILMLMVAKLNLTLRTSSKLGNVN